MNNSPHIGKDNISQVATGEVWLGGKALELGLIDELKTSDDVILNKRAEGSDIFLVSLQRRARSLSSLLNGGDSPFIETDAWKTIIIDFLSLILQ